MFFKLKADLQPYCINLVYINLTIEVCFMVLMSCKEYVLHIIIFKLFPQSCSCNLKLLYNSYFRRKLEIGLLIYTVGLFSECKLGRKGGPGNVELGI